MYDHLIYSITKQLILCREYKENLHTDNLAGADSVNSILNK